MKQLISRKKICQKIPNFHKFVLSEAFKAQIYQKSKVRPSKVAKNDIFGNFRDSEIWIFPPKWHEICEYDKNDIFCNFRGSKIWIFPPKWHEICEFDKNDIFGNFRDSEICIFPPKWHGICEYLQSNSRISLSNQAWNKLSWKCHISKASNVKWWIL